MNDVPVVAWMLLALGALIVGVSKASLPGASTLSVAVFAAVLPARSSTATLLLLLIVGDVFALASYRRHADWRMLVRLAPAVLGGVLVGALFLAFASDQWVRRTIGVVLLLLITITLVRRAGWLRPPSTTRTWPAAVGYGTLGGFTTMVANAGGPVMSLYFLAMRMPVLAFLGTSAWFFAVINLVKVPFAIGLGLLTVDALWLVLTLVPFVIAGGLVGRVIARRIDQRVFEWIVIALTVAGAVFLVIQ